MSPRLHRFHGGIHPPEHKTESNGPPIATLPLPPQLVLPLRQHLGNAAEACVHVDQMVLKGQIIARADGVVSAALHAPTSGTVTAIAAKPLPHPSQLAEPCIVIEPDGRDAWQTRQPFDWQAAGPRATRDHLCEMGVVGLGGAVFPSHIKLGTPSEAGIETLIINGAECEPYITCDDRLMRERAADIIGGIEIMRHLMQARSVKVGIEDNKPDAIAAMVAAAGGREIEIVPLPTLYPSGGAKQLIRLLTGIEVPGGTRATELGVQCFNVGTAYAIARAVWQGEPLISRIVTLAGNVQRPQNVEALLGTSVDWLMQWAGQRPDTDRILMGGPLMGIELPSPFVPVVKATNCLLAGSPRLLPKPGPAMPCIRCGECAQVCPAELQPQDLYWFAKAQQLGKAQEWHLFDCIECGACSYVCPSQIPLVQFYQAAKADIWDAERKKRAADQARLRHEFRAERLARDKAERAAKLASKAIEAQKAATAAKAEAATNPEAAQALADKQAIIQAALARAQAQRQAADTPANPTPADTPAPAVDGKQALIQAAMARAAAKRAAQATPDNPPQVD
ncbi:electron transport complex protein RnfC [Chitinivorax tropicus]|uniref:Ion-translocating oxidoreductase complex subunit C n=1 Tax=Chitinivorax tropicus TaxID=714531 RepID=A0A840MLA5_9PROT|nr:electron transport complex subunit RsxC [Chitinivorax tropicus]MBB5019190.1 electron transport complex protein RnfC [Chitinivorax tropicus]